MNTEDLMRVALSLIQALAPRAEALSIEETAAYNAALTFVGSKLEALAGPVRAGFHEEA